jgi:beta-galactosidase
MRPVCWRTFAICLAMITLSSVSTSAAPPEAVRLQLAADSDWKFVLGDPQSAETKTFNDASWRPVDLPHDWSIEGKFNKDNPSGSGGGFYPTGTGWYRKTFSVPAAWEGKRVSVEFDGVYMNATVFLNGRKLGTQPYGYTSFHFDLTPDLDFTAPNTIAVRVDNSAQPNSRWYSGSGIYRHVRIVVTDPTHVAHWGVFITTPDISKDHAKVSVRTRVANEAAGPARITVQTTVTGPAGASAGNAQSGMTIAPGAETETTQEISVANPALWSPESPKLYQAVTRVMKDGKVIDEVVTPFGIRSLAWSVDKGFLLNGKPIKFAGGSVHHDNGLLGAATFDRAEERKVELLKAAGYNAVRTAHNPPSPAFLDACDRIGLLVLDEPFDTWKVPKLKFDYGRYFDEWWQRDIAAMVQRDRNHASVVMWGIGNEIPEVFTDKGGSIAKQLATQVRSLDSTRPLTQALPGTTSGPNADAVFSVLDIGGYNYNLAKNQAADHQRVPSRIMVTTESFPADAFEQWQLVKSNPYIVGEFVWTAMDYLGESGIGAWAYGTPEQAAVAAKFSGMMQSMVDQYFLAMVNGVDMAELMKKNHNNDSAGLQVLFPGYPWHASNCGDLDLTGHRKPQSYYRDILWNGGDRVYPTVRLPEPDGKKIIAAGWSTYPTLPSWTWPGREGKDMLVDVYSGAEKVRLFLNDKLIGEMPTGEQQQFKATFTVPYAPGSLKAVGVRGSRIVAEGALSTAGDPERVRLTADRAVIRADGQDLSFITVEALDAQGRPQPNANQEIVFNIAGPGRIAAVGNADGQSEQPYQGNRCKLFNGRATIIVRSSRKQGRIELTANAQGLSPATIAVQAQPAERPEI